METVMRISVEQAAERLEELVERAERGEEIVLTRNDQPSVALRLVSARETISTEHTSLSPEEKDRVIDEIVARARKLDRHPEISAARSQDFLYDDDGLPG